MKMQVRGKSFLNFSSRNLAVFSLVLMLLGLSSSTKDIHRSPINSNDVFLKERDIKAVKYFNFDKIADDKCVLDLFRNPYPEGIETNKQQLVTSIPTSSRPIQTAGNFINNLAYKVLGIIEENGQFKIWKITKPKNELLFEK